MSESDDLRHNNAAACSTARHWAYRNVAATQAEIEEMARRFSLGYDADLEPIKNTICKVLADFATGG